MGQTLIPKRPSKVVRYTVSLLFIIVIAAATSFAGYFKIMIPDHLLTWLLIYNNPIVALMWFGLGFAAMLVLLLKSGIGFRPISRFIENRTPFIQDYLCGSPYWVVTSIFLVCLSMLWITRPSCQTPSIVFIVQEKGKSTQYVPGSFVSTGPNTTLIITASDMEENEIRCLWSSTGKVVTRTTSAESCSIIVRSDVNIGITIFTVNATQGFCEEFTLAPLEVRVSND